MSLYQYRNVLITARAGDIVTEPADGLMTLINSAGLWFGGVDEAIMSVAGGRFHQLAARQMPPVVEQGTVLFADGSQISHEGAFQHVIFVIDDLKIALKPLVRAGLESAYAHNLKSVSLPMMRTGVMKGRVEKTPDEVAFQMAEAIKEAADAHPDDQLAVKVIIFSQASLLQSKLLAALALPE